MLFFLTSKLKAMCKMEICESRCYHFDSCCNRNLHGVCIGYAPYPESEDDEDEVEQRLERATY